MQQLLVAQNDVVPPQTEKNGITSRYSMCKQFKCTFA